MAKHETALLSRRRVLAMLGVGSTVGVSKGMQRTAAVIGRKSSFKTIGVIGGMGPQATIDFEYRLHRAAQRIIPQRENSRYPTVVTYFHRRPPFAVNKDLHPLLPLRPDPHLLDASRRLGAWADFLVIPSNGPHLIQHQIEEASGRRILSMVEITLKEIERRGWRTAGVLGFGNPTIYTEPLRKRGIGCEIIDGDLRARLDREIMRVMEGRDDASSTRTAEQALEMLRRRKVSGIILGCTEIPLLLREKAAQADLVNPAEFLAEAAVKFAVAPQAR